MIWNCFSLVEYHGSFTNINHILNILLQSHDNKAHVVSLNITTFASTHATIMASHAVKELDLFADITIEISDVFAPSFNFVLGLII